jgi:hypothetical protein
MAYPVGAVAAAQPRARLRSHPNCLDAAAENAAGAALTPVTPLP